MMKNYIEGKVIIITGAASGFGRLTSCMAAEKGAKVVCADIDEKGLKEVVTEIKAKSGQAAYIVTDVTVKEQVDAMAKFAKDTYGRIDVLVNNAGIMPLAFFSDHEKAWKAWDKCIDINIKGVVNGISAVYDIMEEQQQGQIINISSIYGNYPVIGSAVYQATKIAVRYLTETLRQEASGFIKTTIVSPTGTAGTNLGSAVVNDQAVKGAIGLNYPNYLTGYSKLMNGELPEEKLDRESIKYWMLDAVSLSESIIHVIDQPWGVNISNITVRASGEPWMI